MATIALAGRRIDAPASKERFPLRNVETVERRTLAYLRAHEARRLVCSAACGADLLALRAAQTMRGVIRTIVLPFGVETFRLTSVIDRPGDWSDLYTELVSDAGRTGNLVVLGLSPGNKAAYAAATDRIVEEAARTGLVRCCIVWEGS